MRSEQELLSDYLNATDYMDHRFLMDTLSPSEETNLNAALVDLECKQTREILPMIDPNTSLMTSEAGVFIVAQNETGKTISITYIDPNDPVLSPLLPPSEEGPIISFVR